ncbi:AraC family transcriptional regulator [Opitutus sp. GAS368]|uniref:AraC family transcriptional regulator n=1 Tax=Opitutus sp. GAS368 TaxID=1882749 RepID=UPI00087B7A86|nr:AraC family transcriptional regulator [Opitutus sp. GAS368]SDR84355.1 transcriptional regulator, AraC family [Opitutus sp. GAS368]
MFSSRALRPVAVTFPAHGIFVLESHHTRGFRMPPVRHDFLKVIQPFAGGGWLVRKGLRVPLQPGDVVLVPAGERHHIEDSGTRPLSLYALCVAPAAPTPVTGGVFRAYRHFPSPPWGPEFRGLIRHLLHEQTLGRPGSDLMMLGLTWQALGHIARAASGRQPLRGERTHLPAQARVAAYAAELSRTFYHRQSVDAAAAALGLSRRHFTQLFRGITGESWLERLRLYRLAHARRLLRETGRSATSIGYECGFEDITTFYRTFKAAEGTSPLAWRNSGGVSARLRRRPHRQKTASSTPN